MDKTEELFKELTEAFGPAGYEEEIAKIMQKHFEPLTQEITFDNLGSVIGIKKGNSEYPKVMISAHMDEVGFIVKEITKEGYLRFLPLGGWWSHLLPSQRVIVRTKKGDYTGIVGSTPIHKLTRESFNKVQSIKDMYIDLGVEEGFDIRKELGVREGDPIIPKSDFTIMKHNKLYIGKAWDDRIGCAIMLDVLKNLQEQKHPNTIYAAATVQEEVGTRGAMTSGWVIEPDVAFALEVSIARDTPDIRDIIGEKLGGGVSILVYDGSMIPNTKLRDLVVEVAENEKIPFHYTSVARGATDMGPVHKLRRGTPGLVIGVPTRYIHAHNGILNREDYDNTVKLMTAVMLRLDGETVANLTRR